MKKNLVISLPIIIIAIIVYFFLINEKTSSMYYIDKYTNTKIKYTSDEVTSINTFINQLESVKKQQIIDTYGKGTIYFGEQPKMYINEKSVSIFNTKLENYIIIISDDVQDNYYISSKNNIDKLLSSVKNISKDSIHLWEGE